MTDTRENLRAALQRARVEALESDLAFIAEREKRRPPEPLPARSTEPALLPRTSRWRP